MPKVSFVDNGSDAATKNGKHIFTRTHTQTHFYPVWNVQPEEDLTHGGGMRKEATDVGRGKVPVHGEVVSGGRGRTGV